MLCSRSLIPTGYQAGFQNVDGLVDVGLKRMLTHRLGCAVGRLFQGFLGASVFALWASAKGAVSAGLLVSRRPSLETPR